MFLGEIINSFEYKTNYDVIYLDFKKAFDMCPTPGTTSYTS